MGSPPPPTSADSVDLALALYLGAKEIYRFGGRLSPGAKAIVDRAMGERGELVKGRTRHNHNGVASTPMSRGEDDFIARGEFFTAEEAAETLGVTPEALKKQARQYRIPASKNRMGEWCFPIKWVEGKLARQLTATADDAGNVEQLTQWLLNDATAEAICGPVTQVQGHRSGYAATPVRGTLRG